MHHSKHLNNSSNSSAPSFYFSHYAARFLVHSGQLTPGRQHRVDTYAQHAAAARRQQHRSSPTSLMQLALSGMTPGTRRAAAAQHTAAAQGPTAAAAVSEEDEEDAEAGINTITIIAL
jgi:hypothetical protein